jgi:hypothetical protein
VPSKLPIAVLSVQTPHGGGHAGDGVLDGLGGAMGVASGIALEAVIAGGACWATTAGCSELQAVEIKATTATPKTLRSGAVTQA